jgi:hypothetical protein
MTDDAAGPVRSPLERFDWIDSTTPPGGQALRYDLKDALHPTVRQLASELLGELFSLDGLGVLLWILVYLPIALRRVYGELIPSRRLGAVI